jgi:hypothetical protein
MKTVSEIVTNMAHATGTDGYTRHISGILLTDGVTQLREDAECYWLIDAIGSYFPKHKEEFQLWELKVNDKKAVLTMKEDSDQPELVRQEIPYTDFPIEGVKFYLQYGSIDGETPDYILMLTSEY